MAPKLDSDPRPPSVGLESLPWWEPRELFVSVPSMPHYTRAPLRAASRAQDIREAPHVSPRRCFIAPRLAPSWCIMLVNGVTAETEL